MAVIEEHGYFWWSTEKVPEGNFAPENAVPGYLEIADNGTVKLELHGFLSESIHPLAALFTPDQLDGKSIQGILKASNSNVLLLDLESDGGHVSTGGISHQNFRAWRALVGNDLIECDQNLRVSGFSVELEGFEDWLLLGGINGTRNARSVTVKAKLSKTYSYKLRNSKLTLKTRLKNPIVNFKRQRKLTIEEHAQLEYFFHTDLSLEQTQDKFLLVSDLLTLLSGSSRSLDWPRIHLGRGKSEKRYKYFYGSSRNLSQPAKFFDCWVTFPQISEKFGDLLQSWDDAQSKLGSGLQLFVGTLKSNSLHLEHKFTNFIWGLEVLHRLKNPNAVQSAKFKEKIDRIISNVKLPKDRTWLNDRLQNAHEPSLQQRLIETITSLEFNFEEKSLTNFCKVCADLRNDLSHFGGQRTFSSYDEMIQALHEKLGALEFLYHAIALKEIGIETQTIKNFLFAGRHSYKFLQISNRAGLTINKPK
ncbi:HEPN domain-containing protein [Pseudomonas yamanorum]|uniref:ApeA N-terminal domain 1-containing protein n=1 Tax=Pseudomonas yamanorum TaxID=515393 RepID=UPI003BA38771